MSKLIRLYNKIKLETNYPLYEKHNTMYQFYDVAILAQCDVV